MASSETVTVVCKLPTGLICDVVDMADYESQSEAAKKNLPVYVKRKGRFRIRGYNEARLADSAGTIETEARHVIGLFGITQNVPKDLWDEWWAQSQDYPPVRNGLIYAHAQTRSAEAYAKERVELKTGFDALDPNKPAPGIKPESYQGMPPIKD